MAEPAGIRKLSRPLLAAKWAIPPSRSAEVVRSRLHEKLLAERGNPADDRGRASGLGQDDAAVAVGPRPR